MSHLRSVSLRSRRSERRRRISVQRACGSRARSRSSMSPTVTFLVGENGSGKSTLLEGIALAARLPTVGSASANRTRRSRRSVHLARALRPDLESPRASAASFSAPRISSGSRRRCRRCAPSCSARWHASNDGIRGPLAYAKGLAKGPHRVVAPEHGAAIRRRSRRELARAELSQAVSLAVRAGRALSARRA